MIDEKLKAELDKLFLDSPEGEDGRRFLFNFGAYCHLIDDIIDDKITDEEIILNSYMIALNVYSSNFYRNHQDVLYPVIRNVHHTYADSIKMEKAPELWQKEQADVLKSVGVDITLTVIEILGGYPKRRELSILVREHSFNNQHTIIDNIYEQ